MSDELISSEYQVISSAHFLKRCFEAGNFVPTPTALVRTEVQHLLGGYRSDLPHTGDLEMWMRFAAHGPVGVVHALQAYKGNHESNMSIQYFNQSLGDLKEVLQACEQAVAKWGGQFPESGLWLDLSRKCAGETAFWRGSKAFDHGDIEGCMACLEFAERIDPGIRQSKAWQRLQKKKLIGHRLWRAIRPALDRLRKYKKPFSQPAPGTHSPMAQLAGWWPEYHS
jgi:hypothetical protein